VRNNLKELSSVSSKDTVRMSVTCYTRKFLKEKRVNAKISTVRCSEDTRNGRATANMMRIAKRGSRMEKRD
jgi:hypothetical protein